MRNAIWYVVLGFILVPGSLLVFPGALAVLLGRRRARLLWLRFLCWLDIRLGRWLH